MKKVFKIIIPAMVLCMVIAAAVWVLREKSMPLKVEEVIGNLEWGMGEEEARLAMVEHGCVKFITNNAIFDGAQYTFLRCYIQSYQGMEGVPCEARLTFKEGKLKKGLYYFSVNQEEFPISKEKLEEIQVLFAEQYEKHYEDSINSDTYGETEPEDPNYHRHFVSDQSLITLARENKNRFSVTFVNVNDPGIKEYISALRILDSTSPTGLYDDVQQFD